MCLDGQRSFRVDNVLPCKRKMESNYIISRLRCMQVGILLIPWLDFLRSELDRY
jgi:hypothetical protein